MTSWGLGFVSRHSCRKRRKKSSISCLALTVGGVWEIRDERLWEMVVRDEGMPVV